MKKTIISVIIIGFLLFPIRANAISAESCIVIDAESGETLYELNADRKMLIASVTKIMTALVALEHGNPDDEVTITPESVNVEGSSMYLKAGEAMTLEELLYGMLLVSGNDAAAAVAYHIAGSIEGFAELMNDKAVELGLDNTSFTNPHGLDDDGHYSTARDIAVIMQAAMKNEVFARIVSTKSVTIDGHSYTNHNKLLWTCEGATGGKTGYTKAAGRTLVSCCEREGVRLICVTLNDSDDWKDHIELYNKIFQEYKKITIADANEAYAELPVISGRNCDSVTVRAEKTVTLMLTDADNVEIAVNLPKFVYAEVTEGDTVGYITWTVNGDTGGTIGLVFTESIERQKAEKTGFFDELKEKFMSIVEYNLNRFGYYGS